MENNEKMEKVRKILGDNEALSHALFLLQWDLETEAPALASEKIAKTIGYLTGESYSMIINDEFRKLVYDIDTTELNELDRKVIEDIRKEYFDKLEKIPKEEYKKYSELKVMSARKWEEAKNSNDYDIFKECLGEIIEYNKKFIKYRGYEGNPYNTLLDDYEPEMDIKELDSFFDMIRTELSPFIKKVIAKGLPQKAEEAKKKFSGMSFPIDRQKKLAEYLLEVIKFRFDKGVLKESEHPFTSNVNNKDVRITTHYYEDNLLSSVYSTIHEGGHALYEQNIDDDVSDTVLGTGVSMGIHESQSRIYENMFGRSREFSDFIYLKVDEYFNLSGNGIDNDDFYKIMNEVGLSFIRIEADELTYPIHVLIRYEMEKEIFSNIDERTDVDRLPEKWADKYEEYLGIRPKTYSEGILQDVHWSSGLFGYFPSYALGSAYAAQIYATINGKVDISKEMRKGEFSKINEILRENIHKYGKTRTPKELILNMTGKPFDAQHYIDYLKQKFSSIYEL